VRRRALVLAMVGGALFAGSARAQQPRVDYDAAFSKKFPLERDEHPITDWPLYEALVTGDVVGYAVRVDAALALEQDRIVGRAFQIQQFESRIKQDRELVAAFEGQRKRLKSMIVSTTGGGDDKACPHAVVYVDNEFRVVIGQTSDRADPLWRATIAPGCAQTMDSGFRVTAGRSPRFTCWPTVYTTSCGWRLPDMPVALKRIIESDYPARMTLRWHWRGLGASVRGRSLDADGNRVALGAGATVTVPLALGLDFVDQGGHVLWNAPPLVAAVDLPPRSARGSREARR